MPFFAKHWAQRVSLALAGLLVSSFGPDEVPAAWKPALFWLGIALVSVAAAVWPVVSVVWQRAVGRFPERHKAILQELAAPLATVQEQALTYGQRDLPKLLAAKAQAEELIGQIPYDQATVTTVRDFLQACMIVMENHNSADEMRQARQDVYRISPDLFRFLHSGERVDRRKVDLPAWCRNGDREEADQPQPRSQAVTVTPPPAQVTYEQAFKERSDDRIPFVRIRDLAPAYGLGLAHHDPDGPNVAYRIEGALRQAAVDGEIKVWGRRYRDVTNMEPMVSIPPLHFEEYGFAHGVLNHPSDNKESRTNTIQMATWGQKGKTGATYYDLYLSFGDTEKVLSKVSRGAAP